MSDTIYSRPGETFFSELENAPTGLVGTVAVRVINKATKAVVIARTTAGIEETPAGSGLYAFESSAPLVAGEYRVLWDLGKVSPSTVASDDLVVTYDVIAPGAAPPVGAYVSIAELREEAGATEATMPNAMASRLIRLATAIVENALGDRPRQRSGPQEGLKIAEADVEPFQWSRLRETILILGLRFFENPDLLRGIQWDSVSGPDFSRSGGSGKVFGNEAALLFASTGLMPSSARARA